MQQRPQPIILALLAVGIGALLLFAFLNRGPDAGALTGPTWQLASITGQTPAYQGVIPAAEQSRYTIAFADDGSFIAKADCNAVAGTLRIGSPRRHHDHARSEHARGLPGRFVREPLRTCARDRDDLGDRGRRVDADDGGRWDRHVRGRLDRGRGPDGDGVARRRVRLRRRRRRPAPTPSPTPTPDAPSPTPQPDRRRPARRRPPTDADRDDRADGSADAGAHAHPDADAHADPGTDARTDPGPSATTSSARAGSSSRSPPGIPCRRAPSPRPSAPSTRSRLPRVARSARPPTATRSTGTWTATTDGGLIDRAQPVDRSSPARKGPTVTSTSWPSANSAQLTWSPYWMAIATSRIPPEAAARRRSTRCSSVQPSAGRDPGGRTLYFSLSIRACAGSQPCHDGDRALLVTAAAGSRRTMAGNDRQGDAPPMPHVATSTADLLSTIRGAAHLDGDLLVIDDEAAFRSDRHPRPRLDGGVLDRRGDDRGRPVDRLGGEPGARRARAPASRSSTRRAAAARCRASRCRPSTCGPRPSTWRGPRSRRPPAPTSVRSSSRSPAASRPTRSSGRSTSRPRSWPARSRPAGGRRSSSRATTTSSTPRSTPPTPRR